MSHVRQSNPIDGFRQEIDRIDDDLIDLLEKRLEVSRKIGVAKRAKGLPILDSGREQQIRDNIRSRVQPGSTHKAIEEIYTQIFDQCKKNQSYSSPAIARSTGQFPKVAIIGLGLIGGALARQIRRRLPDTTIRAFDSNGVSECAVKEGVIDKSCDDLLKAAGECSLVILAATPEANLINLRKLAPHLEQGQLVIDVTSTKEKICEVASNLSMRADFIGGHPMFGSEKSGFENSKDVIVEEKSFLLSPTLHSSETSVKRLSNWISSLGLTPQTAEAQTHDACLAVTSHLVQLIVIALANCLQNDQDDKDTISLKANLSGPSFRGLTRLMASPSKMWIQIFQLNKDHILNAIDRFQLEVCKLRTAIENDDAAVIKNQFEKASRVHRAVQQS